MAIRDVATSTHDTKLGEDVRARIDALSEIPDEWGREVARWMRLNRGERIVLNGEPAPDRNDEYRFYQALVGVWPLDAHGASRAGGNHRAAAGVHDQSGEGGKTPFELDQPQRRIRNRDHAFVARVLSGPGGTKFLPAFLPFQARIARVGLVNSLSQVVLKIASPGVPDFYQGTELWDFNLVDPDNRRPVDFARARQALAEASSAVAALPARAAAKRSRVCSIDRPTARIKMFVTTAGLELRTRAPRNSFSTGTTCRSTSRSACPATSWRWPE